MNIIRKTVHVDLFPRPHRYSTEVYFDGEHHPEITLGPTRDKAYTKMEDYLETKGFPGPYKRVDRQ